MKKIIIIILCCITAQVFSQSLLDNREKEIALILNENNSPDWKIQEMKRINSFYISCNIKEKKEVISKKRIAEKKMILNLAIEDKEKFLQESEEFFKKIINFSSPVSVQENLSIAEKNKSVIGTTNDVTKKRELNSLDVERVRQRDENRFSSSNIENNGYNGYVVFNLTKRCSNEYRMLQEVSFVIYEVDDKGKKMEGTSSKAGNIKVSEKRYFYLPDGLYRSEMTYHGKTWVYFFEVVSGEKTGYDNEGFSYEWRSRLEIYK